jgi:hypothetical protein
MCSARHVILGGDPRRLSDVIRVMTDHVYTTFYRKLSEHSMAMWLVHRVEHWYHLPPCHLNQSLNTIILSLYPVHVSYYRDNEGYERDHEFTPADELNHAMQPKEIEKWMCVKVCGMSSKRNLKMPVMTTTRTRLHLLKPAIQLVSRSSTSNT